jgi:hypothetical protein
MLGKSTEGRNIANKDQQKGTGKTDDFLSQADANHTENKNYHSS